MTNKKIYGFLFLALIIMLLPIGMVSTKYKQIKEVGSVTLDITTEPPILSVNWKNQLGISPTTLIVDSFKDETDQKKYSSLNWEEGVPVGYDPSNGNGFKNNVRLFENGDTAYILAIGNNPVTFPQDSSNLFNDWFHLYQHIQEIEFNSVVTSNTENMSWMFWGCDFLTSLNISSFNTSKVTDMNGMFAGCSSMTNLEFGNNFDTSKVINMSDMFNGCGGLTSLNVSDFNTSSVTNIAGMFHDCDKLTTINLSSFDTSNVTDMSVMFKGCSSLTALDLSVFNTSNVTNMNNMFDSCYGLTALDLSNFNTSEVTDMTKMYYNCKALTSLDLSSFNTSNVESMQNMFSGCVELETIFAGDEWNTDKLTTSLSYQNIFFNCTSLVGGEGTTYNASHIGKDYARIDDGPTNPGYLSRKQTITSINTFSLVQEGGTIIGTQTTNSED